MNGSAYNEGVSNDYHVCTIKASYSHLLTRPETEKQRTQDKRILYIRLHNKQLHVYLVLLE